MNKRIFALLMALALVLTCAPIAAEAVIADADVTTANTLDEIVGKACTGEVSAYCAACKETKTWTPMEAITAQTDLAVNEDDHVHLYLAGDVTSSGTYFAKSTNKVNQYEKNPDGTTKLDKNGNPITDSTYNIKACINLNGHTITNTAGHVFQAGHTSAVNIMGKGNIVGGKNYALFVQTANIKMYGEVVIKMAEGVVANPAVVLLGTNNLNANGSTTPILWLYDSSVIDGLGTSRCVLLNGGGTSARLKVFGGTVKNGFTTGNGGNVYVQQGVLEQDLGGTITGGVAVNTGGNIQLNGTNAHYNFIDGILEKGAAANYGGNIWALGGKVRIGTVLGQTGNPVVKEGFAKNGGANIAVNRAGGTLWQYNGLIDATGCPAKATINGTEYAINNNGRNIFAFNTIAGMYFMTGEVKHSGAGNNVYLSGGGSYTIEMSGDAKVGQICIPTSETYPTILVKEGFEGTLGLRYFGAVQTGFGPGAPVTVAVPEAGYANTGTVRVTGADAGYTNPGTLVAREGKFYGKADLGVNKYDDNYKHQGLDGGYATIEEALAAYQANETPAVFRLNCDLPVLDLSDFEGHIEIGLNKRKIGKLIIGPNAEVEIWDFAEVTTEGEVTTVKRGSVGTIENNGGTLLDVAHAVSGGTYILLPTGEDGASNYQAFYITTGMKAYLRTSSETLAFRPTIGITPDPAADVSADMAMNLAGMIEDCGVIISGGSGSETISYFEHEYTMEEAFEVIYGAEKAYNKAVIALESDNTNWWDEEITATAYITVNGTTYECRHKTVSYLDAVMELYESNATVQAMVNNSANKSVYTDYFAANTPEA